MKNSHAGALRASQFLVFTTTKHRFSVIKIHVGVYHDNQNTAMNSIFLLKSTRKTGMNVGKFGINVVIYGTKMWCFFETFYHYNLIF